VFPEVELFTQRDLRGGHCGFIRDWHLGSWAEDYIAARLAVLPERHATAAAEPSAA
jgi:predicted alpha/beta-fold hydrolase